MTVCVGVGNEAQLKISLIELDSVRPDRVRWAMWAGGWGGEGGGGMPSVGFRFHRHIVTLHGTCSGHRKQRS